MSQTVSSGSLTRGQQRWLEHLRACEVQGCSLKQYALEHGLSAQAAYVAKCELKRRGAWPVGTPSTSLTLVPISVSAPALRDSAVVRISLPNGALIEVLEQASVEHAAAVLATVVGAGR
jgi:hypothetical protein